jgi:hypothetical protein
MCRAGQNRTDVGLFLECRAVAKKREVSFERAVIEGIGGEEVEVHRRTMAESQRNRRSPVEDELAREAAQLGPELALRFGQDVQSGRELRHGSGRSGSGAVGRPKNRRQ